MKNLLETEWTGYRDSVYDTQHLEDPAPYDFDIDHVHRAFFAGATALLGILGDHAHHQPDETVAALKTELRAFAARLIKEARIQ